MEEPLRCLVWERAQGRCEYCLLPQSALGAPHQIDHILPEKHHGRTVARNLALACMACNNHKGPNLAGLDPKTGDLVRLFNPRRHKWTAHFEWDGPIIVGKTPIGRATVEVLCMNLSYRIALRSELLEDGLQ